jgi:hypothetical protein
MGKIVSPAYRLSRPDQVEWLEDETVMRIQEVRQR